MLKQELLKLSPVRVLEKSINGGLGKGNMGVFTARKGIGKTAALVHVAVDKLLRDEKVLHISFSDNPRHIETWYEQVFNEIANAYQMENVLDNHQQIIRNRLIVHFKKQDSDLLKVQDTIEKCTQGAQFEPSLVIVDGFSFYNHTMEDFKFWKNLSENLISETWFSATLHRHNLEFDETGIPVPTSHFKDIFSVIIMLEPVNGYVSLKLLKDHDNTDLEKLKLKLNPKTMLIANHRV